ncbi:M48 family metallopeptidase [Sediminibacillus massiliensis]|uniref:M48 family metallopeptidase n=1 Tax=Sediminibacillus massiliensis TaxID=1926277 RepID=UPI0009884B6F|nr:M48 family metallopeptidase [Sediminibacillus massiliensis]
MKKLLTGYILYLIVIWCYFVYFYPLQTLADSKYAALAHAVFFSKLPLEWLLLYILIKKGWSSTWVDRLNDTTEKEWIKVLIFSLLLVVIYELILLPFNLLWFSITHIEGTSHQTIGNWMYELGLNLLFFWLVLAAGIYVVRLLIKKYKNWWFGLWLIALPIALFVVYIQPVWIDPLYEKFTVMEEGPLKTAIEDFTDKSGLEDATLLQVHKSEKTTAFNAYVTGIMGNARIVFWDTTLQGMPQEEILFILAHEIGHYVHGHVYIGVAGYIVLSFFLFYLTAVIYRFIWSNIQGKKRFGKQYDLKAIPVLLLLFSLLMTASQPVSLFVSRKIEQAADVYAMNHTEDLQTGVESFRRMALESKSDIDPVFWIEWFRFSHPPIQDRIDRLKEEMEARESSGENAK